MLNAVSIFAILSDQLKDWSDQYAERIRCCASETAQCSGGSAAPAALDPARFPDRAIQAVRQAGMQMCRGSRTWPQVLPVDKLPGPAAADGLCTAGDRRAGGGVAGQLPAGARDPGADLRDQPRIAAPPRDALTRCHERIADSQRSTDRCRAGGRAVGQYAGGLARREPGAVALSGGDR
jgi:hypothetical protein